MTNILPTKFCSNLESISFLYYIHLNGGNTGRNKPCVFGLQRFAQFSHTITADVNEVLPPTNGKNTGNPYRDSSSICEVEGCSNQKPCLLSAWVFFFSSLYLSFYLLMRSRLYPSFSFIERFMEKRLLLSSRDFFTSMSLESEKTKKLANKPQKKPEDAFVRSLCWQINFF